MQLRYAFFAGDVQERPGGQYEFQDMANGRQVPAFPADVFVACVLVTERTETDDVESLDVSVHVFAPASQAAAGTAMRVPTRSRVRAPRCGSMPGYEYVPVDVQFTAPHAGAYEIHVERSGVVWYLGFYRLELNGH